MTEPHDTHRLADVAALAALDRSLRRRALALTLLDIERHDNHDDYPTRYQLVMRAVGIAAEVPYAVGVRIDPAEPLWPVVYIELPTGQVSWHMPQHALPFDGHSTDEKYVRIHAFAARETP